MERIIAPQLIKEGDSRLGLGVGLKPPRLDCRVISENGYQSILTILRTVRDRDIKKYVNGEDSLLSQELRKVIFDFLEENENQ